MPSSVTSSPLFAAKDKRINKTKLNVIYIWLDFFGLLL